MVDRRFPVGAETRADGVHFRVWAPDCHSVEVVLGNATQYELEREDRGYYSGFISEIGDGTRYQFRLNGVVLAPDPVSRLQPEGPHGPSQIVDPDRFQWTDQEWKGPELVGMVLYEMHIGSFTPEGTWQAAIRQLAELASLGVNCIEVMPVAEFPGQFGWGYDGVALFAPTCLYGLPDDFRQFVNTAHSLGIAVILDVVYNHLGPDGNYLGQFAADYFTHRYATDWGSAINFDGERSESVREFFITNAEYWISEFHIDGLRIDATQNIYDCAPAESHILTCIAQRARRAAAGRHIILVAENEPQHPQLCRPVAKGGNGLDALWNDDFHHTAMVAVTGHREGYYTDYLGSPQEFISAAKYGYLYQGQWYTWHSSLRGRSGLDLPLPTFVNFIQNHDQIANSARGLRVDRLTSPGRYRALTALTLLMPGTPMLFQGQEFASSAPFLYFADHHPELAALVQAGRIGFLRQFPSFEDERMVAQIPAPHDPETFQRCKLDFSERETNRPAYQMTRDLLKLRRTPPGFQPRARGVDGAVIGPQAFVLRYFFADDQDRLLVVNLGSDLDLQFLPEPLTAPPCGMSWEVIFSTEEPQYGGSGLRSPVREDAGWFVPGELAIVLAGKRTQEVAVASITQ